MMPALRAGLRDWNRRVGACHKLADYRQVTFTGTVTYCLANGKIVEAWWNYDLFGMLQQLSAIPARAEPAAATA